MLPRLKLRLDNVSFAKTYRRRTTPVTAHVKKNGVYKWAISPAISEYPWMTSEWGTYGPLKRLWRGWQSDNCARHNKAFGWSPWPSLLPDAGACAVSSGGHVS